MQPVHFRMKRMVGRILRGVAVIDGRFELATHGTRDMPVWGEIYKRSCAQGQNGTLPYLASKEVVESIVRVRILALIDYIFTLQEGRR
jgi:hypothetical protein